MVRKQTTIVTGLTLAILLLVINYISTRHFVRIDLTDAHLYTLAEATRSKLKALDDIVTIRVYFSRQLPPQLEPARRSVEDLLEEYQQYGGANIQIEHRDPQKDQQTEREMMILGIRPLQVNVLQRDKQEVVRIYLGMVLIHADKKEVIQIDPTSGRRVDRSHFQIDQRDDSRCGMVAA